MMLVAQTPPRWYHCSKTHYRLFLFYHGVGRTSDFDYRYHDCCYSQELAFFALPFLRTFLVENKSCVLI